MTERSLPGRLPLAGRNALVVGAGGPYARLAAIALAEAGARVSIATAAEVAAQETEANSILNECWTLGRDGIVLRLDAADPAAVEAALDRVDREAGPLHLLVHAAPAGEEPDGTLAAATSAFVCIAAARRRIAGRADARVLYLIDAQGTADAGGADREAALDFAGALSEQTDDEAVTVQALLVTRGTAPMVVRDALLTASTADIAAPIVLVGAP